VDSISTLAFKLLMFAKYGCLGISGAGVALTNLSSLDNILEAAGLLQNSFFYSITRRYW
jgi:hypothetical protein